MFDQTSGADWVLTVRYQQRGAMQRNDQEIDLLHARY